MYNNEHSSPAFDEFLDMLGRKVKLQGFDNFRGGLDIKSEYFFTALLLLLLLL